MTPVTRNLLFQRRQKRRVRCMAWCLAMSPAGAVGRSVPWDAGRSAGVQPWQDYAAVRSRTLADDKMLAECVPQRSTVARYRRDAFSGGDPWQLFRFMRSRRGLGREKRQFAAIYRRRASKTGWLWQDMRTVHPKSPANSRLGIHRAKILSGRGPFRCARPSDHARRADLATPRRRRTAPGRQADAICHSPVAPVAPARCRSSSGTRGGVFQLMLQDQLRFLPPRRISKRAVRLPWCTGPNPLAISTSSMRKARQSLSTTAQGSRRPSRPNRANTSTVSRCTRLISPSFAL